MRMPLKMMETLEKKLDHFLDIGMPQLVASMLKEANDSPSRPIFHEKTYYLQYLGRWMEDKEKGLDVTLRQKVSDIVQGEIRDDMKRTGITEEDLKQMTEIELPPCGPTVGSLIMDIGLGILTAGIFNLIKFIVVTASWSYDEARKEMEEKFCKVLADNKESIRDAAMKMFFDYSKLMGENETKLRNHQTKSSAAKRNH